MAYCGYITRLKNVRKHSNADRLLLADCFGNTVIVSLDYTENQLGVYFPVDGQLSVEFCAANDLVRRKDENGNPAGGYLDPEKRNIKAMKLRGEKSDGLFLPLTSLANFTTVSDLKEGDTITILNGVEICKKYIPKRKEGSWHGGGSKGHKTKVNFAPTFAQHVDTEQLAYHLNDFRTGDVVELTLKMHGTSGRTGYLPLIKGYKDSYNCWIGNAIAKISARLRKRPDPVPRHDGEPIYEYGYVTGTRRVVLDEKHDGGFYDDNQFRLEMAKKFEGKLHKGETVYYEIVGFVNENTPIMASVKNSKISDKAFTKQYGEETMFSYGCDPTGDWVEISIAPDELYVNTWNGPVAHTSEIKPPRCEVYVYRMTMSNDEGDVVEMSPEQMRLRCGQMGVKYVPVFEKFMIPEYEETAQEIHSPFDDDEPVLRGDGEPVVCVTKTIINPGEYVLRKVEQYFDGPDPIGKTHIREGVVARIVNRPTICLYKHKNHTFKMLSGIAIEQAEESGALDKISQDILEEL